MFTSDDVVLVLAPHADDETLGAGATIALLTSQGIAVHVGVLTGHGDGWNPLGPPESWDRVRSECQEAMRFLGVRHLHFRELPAAMMAHHPIWETNATVQELVREVAPTVLFVPFQFDLHKDHRVVFDAASVAWRSSSEMGRRIRLVLAYEVQSETHWNAPYLEAGFLPHIWTDVGDHLAAKLQALRAYRSQVRPAPDARSVEAVEHLARWRGSQQSLPAAEAFVLVRGIVAFEPDAQDRVT